MAPGMTEAVLLGLVLAGTSATPVEAPKGGDRPAVLSLVQQQFPKSRGWFRIVSGIRYDERDGGLVPDWNTITHPKVLRQDTAGQRLDVRLPLRADGFTQVGLDGHDGFWVRSTPLGARPVPAQVSDGVIVYPGALPGGDVLYKATPTHLDEYVYVVAPEARRTLRYRLTFGPAVARVRMAANILELLDASGVARLRARPPFVRDSKDARRDGEVSLSGDVLTVSFSLAGLAFPVLIDPDWTTTGRMVWERFSYEAYTLGSGDVLAPAGCTLVVCPNGIGMPACSVVLNRTELYSTSAGTWRDVGTMQQPRFGYSGARLDDGRVLVTGGCTTPRCTAMTDSSELYTPAQETWSAAPALPPSRAWATATKFPDGRVLVVGGCDSGACFGDAAIYEPGTNSWRTVGALGTPRGLHTATLLADGRVLVAGGCSTLDCQAVLASAELFDPASGAWTPTGALVSPRSGHTATLLPGGDVLFAGGCSVANCVPTLQSAERWTVALGTSRAVAPMAGARHHHSAAALSNGQVLVAGGCFTTGSCTRASELYEPITDTWVATGNLSVNRGYMASALLEDGRLLLAGGCNENTCLPWAETYQTRVDPGTDGGVDAGTDGGTDGGTVASDAGVDAGSGQKDAGGPGVPDAGTEPVKVKPCGCAASGGELGLAVLAALGLLFARRRRA